MQNYESRSNMNRPTQLLATSIIFSLGIATAIYGQDSVLPLRQAHAHNDYQHERPLLNALSYGFCSVEADVFLVDGDLLVGHDIWSLKKGRNLRKLYLDPLLALVKKHNGKVYEDGRLFTLLIDFKADGEKIYPVLKRQLEDYKEMLCGIHDGSHQMRAIQIVISGACPRKLIENDSQRLVSIDGRLSDLESKASAELMPLISDRWGSHFKWRGKSKMKNATKEKLQMIVTKAHAAGRRVRFWATPESPEVWNALLAAGVDHINTDKLQMLQQHLKQAVPKPRTQAEQHPDDT